MTLDSVIDDILRREGWPKVTARPSDLGGLTKGGITQTTANQYFGRRLTTKEFVELVDETVARAIYRKMYGERYEFIPSERIRALLVDYAVTSWHDDAVRALQRGLGVPEDGIIGERTRRAVNSMDADKVYRAIWLHRYEKFFKEAYDRATMQFLADNHSTQLHNLKGWLNRLTEFLP